MWARDSVEEMAPSHQKHSHVSFSFHIISFVLSGVLFTRLSCDLESGFSKPLSQNQNRVFLL